MGEGRKRRVGLGERRPLPPQTAGYEGCRAQPPLRVAFRPAVEFVTGGGGQIVRATDAWWARARSLDLYLGGLLFPWVKEGPPERGI